MTIDTDFHSHVSRSSASAMAQSAQKRGLRVLGLSEHVFQMSEVRPILEHMPREGPLLTFNSYIEGVHQAAQSLQFDVRLGLEVDFIPEKNERIQAFIQGYPWDFLIGSVHEIDGIDVQERNNTWKREEGEALWHRYFELQRDAVNSGYFNLVSHPVRMRAVNPHLPANIDEELERLAAEATQRDIALEVNGYDILTYPDLVRHLVKACALHKTPISIGSDAHNPRQVASSHEQSEAILRQAGITQVRIWKHGVAEEYSV